MAEKTRIKGNRATNREPRAVSHFSNVIKKARYLQEASEHARDRGTDKPVHGGGGGGGGLGASD